MLPLKNTMKIKRFDNLWAMGLILFGVLLVVFYILKIFFPEFIIGVAELPSIVEFGNYVDTHKWAYYLFHLFIAYISGYFYYGACYRKYKLDWKENLTIVIFYFISMLIQYFLPNIYSPFLYVSLILQPFIMLFVHKSLKQETFISVCICFIVDILAQAISMEIRNIILLTEYINTATLIILLIDTYIWRVLLYLFFNYKTIKKET